MPFLLSTLYPIQDKLVCELVQYVQLSLAEVNSVSCDRSNAYGSMGVELVTPGLSLPVSMNWLTRVKGKIIIKT
jgi:hypothetical protein